MTGPAVISKVTAISGDRAQDAAQCRAALTPLVESYVRRSPDQCRYLALPPWLMISPAGGGALDSEGVAT